MCHPVGGTRFSHPWKKLSLGLGFVHCGKNCAASIQTEFGAQGGLQQWVKAKMLIEYKGLQKGYHQPLQLAYGAQFLQKGAQPQSRRGIVNLNISMVVLH